MFFGNSFSLRFSHTSQVPIIGAVVELLQFGFESFFEVSPADEDWAHRSLILFPFAVMTVVV